MKDWSRTSGGDSGLTPAWSVHLLLLAGSAVPCPALSLDSASEMLRVTAHPMALTWHCGLQPVLHERSFR